MVYRRDLWHYNDVIMGTVTFQISSLTIVYSTIYSDADQRKHQSSASLAFVRGIHRGSVNSPHKWAVTRKMFPVDDVIMVTHQNKGNKQRVLMHGHQGWNVRHGLCHIYMIYVYIWVVHSFCLFCCLFIIVTTQFVALYEPCKPKPKPKPSTYDTRTTTPWQRSKFRYLDRSQSNKYAINMQIQTISVNK